MEDSFEIAVLFDSDCVLHLLGLIFLVCLIERDELDDFIDDSGEFWVCAIICEQCLEICQPFLRTYLFPCQRNALLECEFECLFQ